MPLQKVHSVDEHGNAIVVEIRGAEGTEFESAGASLDRKSVSTLSERDCRILREDYGLSVAGPPALLLPPLRSWDDVVEHAADTRALTDAARRVVSALGREMRAATPTAVQRQAVPLLLRTDTDLLAVAETGSGKTLAYLVPLVVRILAARWGAASEDGPFALVLVPTRELAQQIEGVAQRLCAAVGVPGGALSIVGGRALGEQSIELTLRAARGKAPPAILVATPGRLRDCLEHRVLSLAGTSVVVLDEADRMLQLAFAPDIAAVLARTDAPQRALFSATMPPELRATLVASHTRPERLVALAAGDAVAARVSPAAIDVQLAVPAGVTQAVVLLSGHVSGPAALTARDAVLRRVLVDGAVGVYGCEEGDARGGDTARAVHADRDVPAVVFVNSRATVDHVVRRLAAWGVSCASLHGGRAQADREAAVAALRRGAVRVLVATDVAARGLDVPEAGLVVQYDMPHALEEYVHRAGRTGRAGRSGLCVAIVDCDADAALLRPLVRLLRRSARAFAPPELFRHPSVLSTESQL